MSLEVEAPASATTQGAYQPLSSAAIKEVPRKAVATAAGVSLVLALGVFVFSSLGAPALEVSQLHEGHKPLRHFGNGWGECDMNTLHVHTTTKGQWNVLITASRNDMCATMMCPQEVEYSSTSTLTTFPKTDIKE